MMDRFYQLPPELRATVVESLVDHWRYADEQESIAPYASVCKEWQALVERYNFSALRVTQESLNEFDAYMVGSRRGLLKQINLHVQLPNYDNDPCEKKETWEDKFENNMCFTKAVHGLFRLMSSWTFNEACREGVDLTLSISSPSDLRNANFELWQRRRWNIKDIGEKRFADSWIDFVGHDEEFARNNPLPRVDVIRSFLASPQNHRALMPAAHADIVARLPCLREASFDILKDRRKETRKIHFNRKLPAPGVLLCPSLTMFRVRRVHGGVAALSGETHHFFQHDIVVAPYPPRDPGRGRQRCQALRQAAQSCPLSQALEYHQRCAYPRVFEASLALRCR